MTSTDQNESMSVKNMKILFDLSNHPIKPLETYVVLTDKFVVRTIHLVKANGKTKCNQFANGCCMLFNPSHMTQSKKCKVCFK